MTIVAMGVSIPYFVFQMVSGFTGESNAHPNELFSAKDLVGPFWYLGLIGFAVYMCKDSFQGRSIAKRVFNLQVVVASSCQPADPIRCVIRNLFLVLWPIEFFFCLVTPARRIGDYVAGTKVVIYAESPLPSRVDVSKLLAAFVTAYLFWLIPMWLFLR